MTATKVRALVIDDSALYRKFVRVVLEDIPSVEVIGTACDGRIGLDKIKQLKPDLITLDQEMPQLDGIGLLQELSAQKIDVASIMISALTDQGAKTTNTALRLGAFDFVLKPCGMSPTESCEQLKSDLTPKIEAFMAQTAFKQKRNTLPRLSPAKSENAIQQMVRKVGSIAHRPKVVGIGVSTGGPAALSQLLPKLPGDFPCPILLVQHMPPKFTKSLAEDLNRHCALEVKEASNGMRAKAGEIYIAPGGSQMRIAKLNDQPVIQITDDPPERNCKPAVDYLFRSIANCYQERSLGVILTGMGDDGTIGCRLLKEQGGRVLSQDQASCVVYGMPRSVYEAGLTDQVAPLDKISDLLMEAVGSGVIV